MVAVLTEQGFTEVRDAEGAKLAASGFCAARAYNSPHITREAMSNAGRDLEQINLLLVQSLSQTRERYLGSEQEIAVPVNDSLGLEEPIRSRQ